MYNSSKYPFPEMPENNDAECLAEKLLFLEEKIASSYIKRVFKRKLYISNIENIKNEFILLKTKSNNSEKVLMDKYIKYCENLSHSLNSQPLKTSKQFDLYQ